MYSEMMVRPMREELTRIGVQELRTAEEVEEALGGKQEGTALLVVNSVCGCAARNARPAVTVALEHEARPDRAYTVFAGQDPEATAQARAYIHGYPPSSPSITLFRDGEVVFMLERHRIEGREAREIASDLAEAFERYCGETAA
jgi:putative YphP/YqiW family bacilliredoxin